MNNTYGIDVGALTGIQRNTIYNNTVGIYYQTTATTPITYNNIMNNTKYNIELTSLSPSVLDATYNYWGTLNITFIDETIYESNDNATLGEVVFLPALSYPGADAPIIPGVDMAPAPTPTPSVTPIPTISPTPYPTPSHTATPTATSPIVEGGLTLVEIGVIAALIIVVLIAVVLLLRRKGGNDQNPPAATPEPQQQVS
jgi:parallel beta-helix repeat protein